MRLDDLKHKLGDYRGLSGAGWAVDEIKITRRKRVADGRSLRVIET